MDSSKERPSSLLVETSKTLLAAVIALVTAGWVARGAVAEHDKRITVLETQMDAIDGIRADVREIRAAIIDNKVRP